MLRVFYKRGRKDINDDQKMPDPLGRFPSFAAAEQHARDILQKDREDVVLLYLPVSNCGGVTQLQSLLGWQGRYRLIRIMGSTGRKHRGTPALFEISGASSTEGRCPYPDHRQDAYPIEFKEDALAMAG